MKALIVAVSLLAFACAKDKNMDEYQRDKLQQNLALYQSVAGSYTGVTYAKEDGRVMGAMQLDLRAETKVDPSNGGNTSGGTPVLVGNVRFLDETVISFSAPNSYYDPGTGVYNADISITRANGTVETVRISGAISNGTLAGDIAARDFPETGGNFRLTKNGRPITDLLKEARPERPDNTNGNRQVSAFLGVTKFESGESKKVRVVLLQPLRNTPEDFLDLVAPIKSVQLSVNYSQTLHLLFNGALYDVRQGLITGQLTVPFNGQEQRMNVECRVTGAGEDLSCSHVTSNFGVTATTEAKRDLKNRRDPPDPDERRQITKTFTGKRIGGGESRKVSLIVTQPTRNRLEDLWELFFPTAERLVNAALNYSEHVNLSFVNAKWDSLNGTLEGSFASGQFTAYLQCTDFYFLSTRSAFNCNYWTTRSPNISFEFRPGR